MLAVICFAIYFLHNLECYKIIFVRNLVIRRQARLDEELTGYIALLALGIFVSFNSVRLVLKSPSVARFVIIRHSVRHDFMEH